MAKTVASKNNADNVSSTKGVKGGYIFSAPVGTELPKDIKTPLNVAFKVLGFISSDGYKESIDSDSEDILDMNGDLLDSPKTSRVESGQVTFAEIKADTLKIQYGEKNVTDESGIITVHHNGDSETIRAYVLELVLKNGRRWRKVVPMGKSDELDELNLAIGELCARPITIKYLSDENGDTCIDYIESTETEAM